MTTSVIVYIVVVFTLGVALGALLLDRKRLRAMQTAIEEDHRRGQEAAEQLEDTEAEVAALTAKLEESQLADVDVLEKRLTQLKRDRDVWEHKFWQQHAIIERILGQRDEWKDMFGEHVGQHLEGQAALEDKIIKLRQNLMRALATINKMRRDADPQAELVESPSDLLPLDAEPVGQAERYYERMKKLLLEQAPQEFDALLERDRIAVSSGGDGLYRLRERVVRARCVQDPERVITNAGALRAVPGDWVVIDGGTSYLVPARVFEQRFSAVSEGSGADDGAAPDPDELPRAEKAPEETSRKSARKAAKRKEGPKTGGSRA